MSDVFGKMFNVCATPHCKENRQPEKDFCKFCAQKHAEENEWALAQSKQKKRREALNLMPSITMGTLPVATQNKIRENRNLRKKKADLAEKCSPGQLQQHLDYMNEGRG